MTRTDTKDYLALDGEMTMSYITTSVGTWDTSKEWVHDLLVFLKG